MNYFNSTLEINSLKIIANEIAGANSNFYEYYVENAIDKIENDKTLKGKNL